MKTIKKYIEHVNKIQIQYSFAFFSISLLHMFLYIPIWFSFPCFWKLNINGIKLYVFFATSFFFFLSIYGQSFLLVSIVVVPSLSPMISTPLCAATDGSLLLWRDIGLLLMLLWTFLSVSPGTHLQELLRGLLHLGLRHRITGVCTFNFNR